MIPPATIAVGPVLVTATSAVGITEVATRAAAADPLLLAGSGSPVVDVLATTLVSAPVAGAVTVAVKFWLAPLASEVIAGQVTTPGAWLPPPEALTKDTPAGRCP
jgi:hypothetical protein